MGQMGCFTPQWAGKIPLYEQLYRYVSEEIRTGRLCAGERLPSKRVLAGHLEVSLSTVESAYSLLVAEGYVEARPRSGYLVCAGLPLPTVAIPVPNAHCLESIATPPMNHCFSTGAVDESLFPFSAWARLMRGAAAEPELLQRGDAQGEPGLRAALCTFLHQYRGVSCRPEQVVVGAGMEYLLGLLHQLWAPALAVALEDPGYPATWRVLEHHRRPTVPVLVDAQGLDPAALASSGADLVYVTPSHQFPMGGTMPAVRRTALLRWAHEKPGRYIVEDDYDSEFRYASRPIPAMQGPDGGQRVIYTGTFSRSIAPSIRAAYLILPQSLLEVYRADFSHGASTVSRYEQRVLEGFLSSGQYGRHLRRVGTLYRARCAALTEALRGAFPQGEVWGAQAGLHLLLTLPGREDGDLVRRAAQAGYAVHGLTEYCRGPSPRPGTLVLGFAGLPTKTAPAAAEALRLAFA